MDIADWIISAVNRCRDAVWAGVNFVKRGALRVWRAIRRGWNFWQTHVPWYVRWPTYALLTAGGLFALLRIIGFTAVGPKFLAAAWQSSIGNVSAYSTFSFLQHITMIKDVPIILGTCAGILGPLNLWYLFSNPDGDAEPIDA